MLKYTELTDWSCVDLLENVINLNDWQYRKEIMRRRAMKKSIFATLFILILVLTMMVGCSPEQQTTKTTTSTSTSTQSEDVITLKIANFQGATSMSHEMWEQWAAEVEEATDNRVKFEIYPGGTLAAATDTYDAVVNGIADIGFVITGYTKGRFSLAEVSCLPGLDYEGWGCLHASKVLWSLWEQFPEIRSQFDDTHVLWINGELYRQLHSTKPVKTLDDIKGMRIRIPGSEAGIAELLGATPVSMAGGEVYNSLERGVIDSDFHPFEAVDLYKFYEVIDSSTITNTNTGGVFIATMNKNTWNKLPADIQEIISKHSGYYGAVELQGEMREAYEQKFYDSLVEEQGLTVYEWSKEDQRKAAEMTQPFIDQWIKDQEDKGLPGQKVYEECLKLIEEYR
jgi:TRAP-type transport system periplasmic protein